MQRTRTVRESAQDVRAVQQVSPLFRYAQSNFPQCQDVRLDCTSCEFDSPVCRTLNDLMMSPSLVSKKTFHLKLLLANPLECQMNRLAIMPEQSDVLGKWGGLGTIYGAKQTSNLDL